MINLTKGQGINLTKSTPSLSNLKAGLGWDVSKFSNGKPFDLDVSVFALHTYGEGEFKLENDSDFCYFDNKIAANESLKHSGDNRTGNGTGDDETILIDLTKAPQGVVNYSIVVNIYDGNTRGQHFGMVENAYIRLVDENTGTELLRYDLSKEYDGKISLQVGSIYKTENGEWNFKAMGYGFTKGLEEFLSAYHYSM